LGVSCLAMETLNSMSIQVGLGERQTFGQKIYVDSMEKSGPAKVDEISPFVKPGRILDICAGAGAVTAGLTARFPASEFVPIDFSGNMVERLKKRFSGTKNIDVVQADAVDFAYDKSFDTAIFVSALHEVYSGNGFDFSTVVQALHNVANNKNFKKGGRLIIRDGVMPEPETLFVEPLNYFAYNRFLKFINGFSAVKNVDFTFGKFNGNNFAVRNAPSFGEVERNNLLIKIGSQDTNEMLSKYHYAEENLPVELSEKFGIWTLNEYQKVLRMFGLKVVHAVSYLLPYLRDTHYSRDFKVYRLDNSGKLVPAPYPDSTMLLVGEK